MWCLDQKPRAFELNPHRVDVAHESPVSPDLDQQKETERAALLTEKLVHISG